MKKKTLLNLQKAAIVASGVIFGIMMTATPILWENEDTISSALGQANAVVESNSSDYTADDLEYYKSSYSSLNEVVYNGFQIQEEEQAEGTVLLKNDNNVLPLKKGSNVSVFGVTGASPFYGASGSGGINSTEAIGWYDAFRGYSHSNPEAPTEYVKGDTLLNINEKLATDYTNWIDSSSETYDSSYVPLSSVSSVNIGDVPWSTVAQSDGYNDIASYGDSAIYIIKRTGGEGYDLPATSGQNAQYGNENNQYVSTNDGTDGDYLQLSPTEISVLNGLKQLKANGTIKNIVLVLNMASTIQLDFLQDDTYDIDACIWTGSVGEVGSVAVAKLLVGDYNFSGAASSTLWSDHLKNPVNNNFMDQNYIFTYEDAYDGAHYYDKENVALTSQYQSTFTTYTVYQEGMYLGYRYTETRYEDYVTNRANAGNYDYDSVVAYPFGYGLSYTDFEFSDMSVSYSDGTYSVSVTVTNTGDVAGKTPVQIYVSKPYGEYAQTNDVQVPSVELVDFGKTSELNPNERETITIDVDESYFASYDDNNAKTYITMDGDYYLIAAQDAHDAVNNLLATKGYTPSNTSNRMDAEGNEDLVKSYHYVYDDQTYAYTESGYPVTNRFDSVDINNYDGRGSNSVEYYSRDNWSDIQLPERNTDGTLVKHNATLSMTQQMVDEMYDQMDAGVVIQEDDTEYPTYGADNGLKLIDLMGESYESGLWDDLLDQLSWEETVELLSNGRHKTIFVESVSKPATGDENGPNGIASWMKYTYKDEAGSAYSGPTNPYAERVGGFDEDGNYIPDPNIESRYTTTGFSSNGVLASSMNKELAKKVGEQIGEEGLWCGQAGLLGTGLNIQRSPYAGRTAEYYSECGTLTGLIGAPEIQGTESKGVHCFIKHCAMNECETARHGVNTWATEQSMREIYLRPFEKGITEGGSFAVMTSFSRMGTTAVANSVEFAQWLRNECELPGIIETDCSGDMTDGAHGEAYVSRIVDVYTGASDLNEYNYGTGTTDYTGGTYTYDYFAPGNSNGNYGELGQAMRESAKRILYHTVTSNAMNGYSSDTIITRITPAWETAVIVVDVVFGILFVGSVIWMIVTITIEFVRRQKTKEIE